MEKLIIAVGLNENATREQNPNLPIPPDEIAADTAACLEAGASARPALPPGAAELLAAGRRGFLLTLRRDGSPTAHPMTALQVAGRLAYNTYRKSAKARNLARDPRTCSLVLRSWDPGETRALVYKGPAREVDPSALARAAQTTPADLPVSEGVARRAQERLASGARALFVVEPEEVRLLERGPGA